jgi:MFS family permease
MTNQKILWLKVWGIAGIQAAITLTWVIYNLYLADLLVKNFGFSKELANSLLIIENGLEAFIEPIFGAYSDRQKYNLGTRIPMINFGVFLSSILFIAIPVLVIFVDPKTIWRWTLPVLAVAWASVMAMFRSPAMALLGSAAPQNKLPQAASILTLVAQLVGAFKFDVYGIILGLGVNFAFAIGSVSLLIAAACLRFLFPPSFPTQETQVISKINRSLLVLIAGTGISIGCALRFLIPSVNKVLASQWGTDRVKLAMTLFFIALGLASLPSGKLANKIGNFKAMLLGLLITVIFSQFLIINHQDSIVFLNLAAIVFGFSMVLNGAIPFVLNLVPEQHSGLGLGMYFGGLTGAFGLFDFVFSKLGEITASLGAKGGAIALISAFILIILSMQNKERTEFPS